MYKYGYFKNGKIEEGLTNEILLYSTKDYTKQLINSTFKNKIFLGHKLCSNI